MIENIEVLYHSSIRINKKKVIYIDPFKVNKNYNDADIIFVTHGHYDHYSEEDIEKVKKENTIIIVPEGIKVKGFKEDYIIYVKPNKNYEVGNIQFTTIPSYNINKQFHPKENEWVGYSIKIDEVIYYIAGDTDITEENKKVKCDVAFVPVGGTYTMNYDEAAELVNTINPKIAVPTHYGSIVGTKQDAEKFLKLLNSDIKGINLMGIK